MRNESVDGYVNGYLLGWCKYRWTDGYVKSWVDGMIDCYREGKINGWIDG